MSRDHSQTHYGPNASFDGYDSDLASAGILIESLRQQLELKHEECISFYNEAETVIKQRDEARQQLDGWIAANSPNGWIDNLRQRLTNSQKQVTLLRDAVAYGVDNSEFNSETFDYLLREALAATEPKP